MAVDKRLAEAQSSLQSDRAIEALVRNAQVSFEAGVVLAEACRASAIGERESSLRDLLQAVVNQSAKDGCGASRLLRARCVLF